MAYNDTFQDNRVAWAKPFERTYKGPLDRSSMFSSYADALEYAKQTKLDSREIGGTSYVGQIITVYGAGVDGVSQETAAYIITAVGTDAALQRLAQTTATGDFAADISRLDGAISAMQTEIAGIKESLTNLDDTDTTYTFSAGLTDGTFHVIVNKPDGTKEEQDVPVSGWTSLVAAANGKTRAHVYASPEDEQFKSDMNTQGVFKLGDLIYFRATDVPDLWVTQVNDTAAGKPLSYYKFAEIDVDHPDLSGYMLTTTANNTFATKAELTSAQNTLTQSINTVSGTASTNAQTIASNKQETDVAIEGLQEQITDITGSEGVNGLIDNKIVTAINGLDVALKGETATSSKTYVKAIEQVDGKINATVDVLPDYTDVYEAKGAAAKALEDANTHTDTKIGDLGESSTVKDYVDTEISATRQTVTTLAGRVQATENSTANHETRIAATETTISAHGTRLTTVETEISAVGARVSTLESNAVTKVEIAGTGSSATIENNTLKISKISTDLLTQGSLPLILDCGNAAQN